MSWQAAWRSLMSSMFHRGTRLESRRNRHDLTGDSVTLAIAMGLAIRAQANICTWYNVGCSGSSTVVYIMG